MANSIEYKALIKAIIENTMIDYIKLQHPNNRKKKYLQEAYITSIALFFDDSFRFELFVDDNGEALSLDTALKIIVDGNLTSIKNTREHLIRDTIVYWYEKNFQNLNLPKTINIAGKTYFICNKSNTEAYIDKQKYIIYLDFNKKESDRDFTKLCLDLILSESEILIKTNDLENLNKYFYLFLKMNGCFPILTKQDMLKNDSE